MRDGKLVEPPARRREDAPDRTGAMTDSASEAGHREPQPNQRARLARDDDAPFSLPRSVDTWPYPSLRRNQSTPSLASSLRRFSIGGGTPAADEEDSGWGDYVGDRRRMEDERRVTQILADPQLRSKMLIGTEDNRYQWHKYWTTGAELAAMRKPM